MVGMVSWGGTGVLRALCAPLERGAVVKVEAILLVVVGWAWGWWWRGLVEMVNGSRGLGGWAGPSWICLSPQPPAQERMGGWKQMDVLTESHHHFSC